MKLPLTPPLQLILGRGLQSLHRVDNQSFGILDLLHDEPNVHRWKLRLPLTSTVDAVLTDKSKSIRENIQSGCQTASYRPHLEFVSFLRFKIVIEQVASPLIDIH
jgi:hypothetical protein